VSKNTLFLFFIFAVIFALSLQVITDTDFGWHLRVGQYIVESKKIPKTDLFSFTNPNYPYVYHSWAGEVLIFVSYELFGLTAVSIMFSLVSTAALFFLYRTTFLIYGKVSHLGFVWVALLAHPIAGVRVRTFGLLFLSIIYFLFIKFEKQDSKLIWLTPLIFLIWANFHGSFILGILTLGILYLFSLIHKKIRPQKIKTLVIVFLLSLVSTLINPYTFRAWQQAISMSYNSYVKLSGVNIDWLPLINFETSGWMLAILVGGFIFTLFRLKMKNGTFQQNLLATFFIFSLVSSRFVVALFVFLVPVAGKFLLEIKKRLNKNILKSPALVIPLVLVNLLLPLVILKNIMEIRSAYASFFNYNLFLLERSPNRLSYADWPYNASLFVENNLIDKNILCEANWSGYLLLLNKDFKVFYWGAMDNFIIDGQSFVFDYLNLISANGDFEEKLKSYNVEAVFLPPHYPLVQKLQNTFGWEKLYEDSQAVVLVKN